MGVPHQSEVADLPCGDADVDRGKEHCWKRFAGMFENDPLFEEVLEDIEAQRREDDSERDWRSS